METVITAKGGTLQKIAHFTDRLGPIYGADAYVKYAQKLIPEYKISEYVQRKNLVSEVAARKKVIIKRAIWKRELKEKTTNYRSRCHNLTGKVRRENNLPSNIHVDHIISVSFCRKLGITPEQACMKENLRFIPAEDNLEKWAFITEEVLLKLTELCLIWGVPLPSKKMIIEHNKKAELSYNVLSSRFKNMN